MLKGREMEKRRGNVKGRGMVKGDGKGKGMEMRRGMVKGRAYLGPHRHLLGVLDPHCCLCTCVSWLCHRWAVSPCHMWCGHVVVLHQCCVVVGPCCLLVIIACSSSSHVWLCRHCGSSSLSALLCCPCHVVVQCHCPCLATSLSCHVSSCV